MSKGEKFQSPNVMKHGEIADGHRCLSREGRKLLAGQSTTDCFKIPLKLQRCQWKMIHSLGAKVDFLRPHEAEVLWFKVKVTRVES